MKNQITIVAALLFASYTQAQDIFSNEVPSVILNDFNIKYPKARDVEWEMKRGTYEVEFEIGWNKDHEIWYTPTGKVLKHTEDISKDEISNKVQQVINTHFKNYRVHDVEKITSLKGTYYKLELSSLLSTNWDLVIDENGKIVSKTRD